MFGGGYAEFFELGSGSTVLLQSVALPAELKPVDGRVVSADGKTLVLLDASGELHLVSGGMLRRLAEKSSGVFCYNPTIRLCGRLGA